MDAVHERCCGLDVHKKSVVACVITPEGREIRRFGTTTSKLLELADWLKEQEVSPVAMESTGVYWNRCTIFWRTSSASWWSTPPTSRRCRGARQTSRTPSGLPSCCNTACCGPAFPERPQRELRELTRYRRSLIQERSREANRIQKLLEGANIKLSSVATDVLGASGRAMLAALAAGETDPETLAGLAKGRLREKTGELQEALRGLVRSHQRFMLESQLSHLDYLEAQIERLDQEVARRLRPFEETVAAVDTIPGVGRRTAEVIAAEMGTDMTQFPSPGHLASWAGVCPGNNRSGERNKRSPVRKGNAWLKPALVEAAKSAGRTKTYLGAQYHRLARRIGANRAAMAVAHSIVVIVHHVIKTGQPFTDLGYKYFEERDQAAITRRAVRQLERLGHKVTLDAV